MSTEVSHNLRALVIEDESDILGLITDYLSQLGYEVAVAETGERGVALAESNPPELVLVDIRLPGIDGREVIRRLRSNQATGKCIIAVCSVLDPWDLADIEADVVITKPFRRNTFHRKIQTVMERREQ